MPIHVAPTSGVAVVEARVDGAAVPLVLDAGSPYTWMRGRTVADWLKRHPDWYRAEGAVGRSNLAMADLPLEREGTLVRLPELGLGPLRLTGIGVLGTGALGGRFTEAALGEVFWDAWQGGVGQTVAGWLGNNVLDDFRITLDYAAGLSHWQRQRPTDPYDLDAAGLSLVRHGSGYAVGAVASRHGIPLVGSIARGDRLLRVDGRPVEGMAPDAVLSALAGRPGTPRVLDIDRDGTPMQVLTRADSY